MNLSWVSGQSNYNPRGHYLIMALQQKVAPISLLFDQDKTKQNFDQNTQGVLQITYMHKAVHCT